MRVGCPFFVSFSIGRGGGAVRGCGIGSGCDVSRWKWEFSHHREIGRMVVWVSR